MYDDTQEQKYRYVKEVLTFFGMAIFIKTRKLITLQLIHFFFIVVACVTLFLLLLTIANAAICWRNFDKGLKAHCKFICKKMRAR
jgi:hypothetical protein